MTIRADEEVGMRGTDNEQSSMFSYISAERRVPKDHPLRAIRVMVDRALKDLDKRFEGMYAALGRPSIAPERLLRALTLQVLYTVRSDRLLKGEVAEAFLAAVLAQARELGLLSDEHFTVDGTLIEAWAGQKSFKRKDSKPGEAPPHDDDPGNPTVDFHGEQRRNDTHQSTTDPEALLARKGKGKEAKLSYAGHVLMENRHGLAVNCCVTQATGRAEPEAALAMVQEIPGWHRVTLGADKGYDRKELVQDMREHRVTPHFACKQTSIIDQRTTRHPGYAISQRKRKRVEEIFGWVKTVGGLRKTRHRGVALVDWIFSFALAAYNLVRMRNLASAPA